MSFFKYFSRTGSEKFSETGTSLSYVYSYTPWAGDSVLVYLLHFIAFIMNSFLLLKILVIAEAVFRQNNGDPISPYDSFVALEIVKNGLR